MKKRARPRTDPNEGHRDPIGFFGKNFRRLFQDFRSEVLRLGRFPSFFGQVFKNNKVSFSFWKLPAVAIQCKGRNPITSVFESQQ